MSQNSSIKVNDNPSTEQNMQTFIQMELKHFRREQEIRMSALEARLPQDKALKHRMPAQSRKVCT
jgi:hypothetical protein